MKSHRFDAGALDPSVLEAVKTYSPEGQSLFIPFAINTAALYYNKDIFNKFGIAFPGDNLTWDDALELAKKLTRSDGGVQYQGFDMDTGFMVNNNQLSISYISKGADKLNSDGLKLWFAAMRRFYDFPSLSLDKKDVGNRDRFLKNKEVAMYAAGNMFNLLAEAGDLNWDMAALPTFKEARGVGLEPNTPYYAISSSSKSKEQAFRAIAVLLDRESQTKQTRNGLLTVLNDTSIKKQVMQDTPFKNKHTEALYKNKFAAPRYVSEYDQFTGVVGLFKDMVVNKTDINTLFREGEESAQKKIDEYKAGQGK
jgi:multiple sugar transport system substrate-binding protein